MRHFCECSFPDRNGKSVFLHCLGRQLVETQNAGGRSGCKAADARFYDRGESVKPEAGSNEPRRIRYERNFEPGGRIFLHARIHADKTDGRIGNPEIVKEFFGVNGKARNEEERTAVSPKQRGFAELRTLQAGSACTRLDGAGDAVRTFPQERAGPADNAERPGR